MITPQIRLTHIQPNFNLYIESSDLKIADVIIKIYKIIIIKNGPDKPLFCVFAQQVYHVDLFSCFSSTAPCCRPMFLLSHPMEKKSIKGICTQVVGVVI
jgi:hypothetical protein